MISQLTSSPTNNHNIYMDIVNLSHTGRTLENKIKQLFNSLNKTTSTGVNKYNTVEEKLKSIKAKEESKAY